MRNKDKKKVIINLLNLVSLIIISTKNLKIHQKILMINSLINKWNIIMNKKID